MANDHVKTLHLVDPAPPAVPQSFLKLQPRTLVHQVIDALVAGASEGLILPGDRIVEADLAQQLVPIETEARFEQHGGGWRDRTHDAGIIARTA